jgi:hypothetical protein
LTLIAPELWLNLQVLVKAVKIAAGSMIYAGAPSVRIRSVTSTCYRVIFVSVHNPMIPMDGLAIVAHFVLVLSVLRVFVFSIRMNVYARVVEFAMIRAVVPVRCVQ